MAVAFMRGSTTGLSDLTITVRDSSNNLIDPYRLEYAIFDYTTGIEVLIGSPVSTPLRISLGEFYADVVIAADANIGLWRIRWTIQETSVSVVYQSVQEFQVVGSGIITSVTGDANFDALVHSLRIILRDNNPDRNYSVDGKEKIRIRLESKEYELSLEDLYKRCFEDDTFHFALIYHKMLVQSVTEDKKIEWKPITDVMKHDVSEKIQYKISLENNVSCIVTEDHSLFIDKTKSIKSIKTKDFKIGDDLVFIESNKVVSRKIESNLIVPSIPYMYDLSVQDNENFILGSGILAHNSFRPPASEKFIQGQTQVFGFVWEDEELIEYLYMAIDDFNSRPPTTGIDVNNLWGTERRWRTTIILRAAAFACFAIAMNWILDEFSYSISGVSLDIEKSSKYQAMKDEYINEYDKLVEANKRSIKLVKGLRQFKYGVGITSALGPMSRPGVQSRRNMISPGAGPNF